MIALIISIIALIVSLIAIYMVVKKDKMQFIIKDDLTGLTHFQVGAQGKEKFKRDV